MEGSFLIKQVLTSWARKKHSKGLKRNLSPTAMPLKEGPCRAVLLPGPSASQIFLNQISSMQPPRASCGPEALPTWAEAMAFQELSCPATDMCRGNVNKSFHFGLGRALVAEHHVQQTENKQARQVCWPSKRCQVHYVMLRRAFSFFPVTQLGKLCLCT